MSLAVKSYEFLKETLNAHVEFKAVVTDIVCNLISKRMDGKDITVSDLISLIPTNIEKTKMERTQCKS